MLLLHVISWSVNGLFFKNKMHRSLCSYCDILIENSLCTYLRAWFLIWKKVQPYILTSQNQIHDLSVRGQVYDRIIGFSFPE